MTQTKTSLAESLNKSSMIKGILLGAGIGLLVILVFTTGAETKPHWSELWKIRPLIITPLAGALGGGLFYLTQHMLRKQGLNKFATFFLCAIGFVVALWMGIVLGLADTLWD